MSRRRVKRWRISDVVRAMSAAAGDKAWWTSSLQKCAVRDAKDYGVRGLLYGWWSTMPRLLRVSEDTWIGITDAEREALVVAEARRLKVPRRA